jgi:hypothetical protein
VRVALARTLHILSRSEEAKVAAARARVLAARLPQREQSHVAATIIDGGSAAGFAAAQGHLKSYPRNQMVLAPWRPASYRRSSASFYCRWLLPLVGRSRHHHRPGMRSNHGSRIPAF